MSSRHGMADDLVEELLAQIDLALPQTRLIWALWVPPKLACGRLQTNLRLLRRAHPRRSVETLQQKEPLHLVAEPGLRRRPRCCCRPRVLA